MGGVYIRRHISVIFINSVFWEEYPFYLAVVFSSGGYPFSFGGGGGGGGENGIFRLIVSISFGGGYYAFGRGVHFVWG